MNGAFGWRTVGVILAVGAIVGTCHAQKSEPAAPTQAPATANAPDAQAWAKFKAAGKGAALTVLPMGMGGKGTLAPAGEVVAMFLERGGMTNLETSTGAFTPPKGADLSAAASAFAGFIKANPTPTEYALYTEFAGAPDTGVTEVRAMVANTTGQVVWQDRQAKGDADFDRIGPREPMQVCMLVAERLRPVLGLGDPQDENAPTGKIAERFQKNAGVPGKAELAAIEKRGKAFKTAAATSSMIVYPAHAGAEFSTQSAKSIAAAINQNNLSKATAADKGPQLQIARDPNEQKVLWGMAHAFSDWIRKNPPEADYAMFADYLMGENMVGGVHLAICNKQGELVVVDFQNNHHTDFQTINPKTREDCDRLLVKRLQGYCK